MKDVFRKEHVGMKVYFRAGHRGVIKAFREEEKYPVIVDFETDLAYPNVLSFTTEGLLYITDESPSLSFKPWVLPADWYIPPEPEIPKDTLLWVRESDDERWRPRYFAGWDGDIVMCYADGRTEKTNDNYPLVNWKQWKIYEEGE